ncbi:MAG: GC-type dockerin domain-anchored protein [Phycisphaerales bacterium JB037]
MVRQSVLMLALAAGSAAAQPLRFEVDPARSVLEVELCVVTRGCDTDTSPVTGYFDFVLDAPADPSELSVTDYRLALSEQINLSVGDFLGRLNVTATDLVVAYPTPGAVFGPVTVVGGMFSLAGVPAAATGTVDYEATGLVCSLVFDPAMLPCSDTIVLGNFPPTPAGGFSGTYSVEGDVATVSSDVAVAVDLLPDSPGTATLTIAGTVVATATIPARCPADLTGSADPNDPTFGVPDGDADGDDFFFYLDAFTTGQFAVCDLTGSSDPNDPTFGMPDGDCDGDDFFFYLDLFVAGCP